MENPTFRLEGVIRTKEDLEDFEGPLNLILMLLSKNKIEIRDIQISVILEQYLDYLGRMQQMDLEVASEFVQMASHLVYIKTKTLLAGTEEVSELELLISSLEQLKNRDRFAAVKQVTPQLAEALDYGSQLFSTPQEALPKFGAYDYRHEPWELMAAMARMLTKPVPEPETETRVRIPPPIVYSARAKGRQMLAILRDGSRSLSELYAMAQSRSELVATFVALLEMCSVGSVRIERAENDYVVRFCGGDLEEILESISE